MARRAAAGRLATEVRARREVRARVRALRPHLVKGLWLVVDGTRAVRLHPSDRAGRPVGVRGWLVALVLLPWSITRVRHRRRDPAPSDGIGGDYTQVVIGAQDTILIADDDHLVRISERTLADEAYVEARSAVDEFLLTPAWEVLEDGRAVREAFVDGLLVSALPPGDQLEACRPTLERCRRLARDAGRGPATELVTTALERAREVRSMIPTDMAAAVDAVIATPITAGRDGPLVPAHGDLKTTNLVLGRGDEPVAIDLEYASVQPFVFDTLNLLTNMVRVGAITPADLYRELARTHEAAGWPSDPGELRRSLVVFAAVRPHRYVQRGRPMSDEVYARALAWSWKLVARSLDEA